MSNENGSNLNGCLYAIGVVVALVVAVGGIGACIERMEVQERLEAAEERAEAERRRRLALTPEERAAEDAAEAERQRELAEERAAAESSRREAARKQERQEQVEACFSAWNGSHREFVRALKDRMNDPSSFEHVETRYRDDEHEVFLFMRFRGANAFGGVVLNEATASAHPTTCEITDIHY